MTNKQPHLHELERIIAELRATKNTYVEKGNYDMAVVFASYITLTQSWKEYFRKQEEYKLNFLSDVYSFYKFIYRSI